MFFFCLWSLKAVNNLEKKSSVVFLHRQFVVYHMTACLNYLCMFQPSDRVRRSKKGISRENSIPTGLGRQSSSEVKYKLLLNYRLYM